MEPEQIGKHGTMVLLLGTADEHSTLQPPPGTAMPSRWDLRYLNWRYFRFPTGITVKSREVWQKPLGDQHNFLREVHGQGTWLDANSQHRSEVALSGAKAHWWIIKGKVDTNSAHTAPVPHSAALYQDELYEMVVNRAAITCLQGFGVIFGHDRVVIYIEPSNT